MYCIFSRKNPFTKKPMLFKRSIVLLRRLESVSPPVLFNRSFSFCFNKTLFSINLINNNNILTKMGSSNCKSFSPTRAPATPKKTEKKMDTEYVEGIVCQENDIKENEMKSYDLGEDGKILLIKQNGVLSAIGNKCTHYGAPLAGGALGDGRVRCQWHGACFNIKTGDIEDFPGLDSLPCYQVSIEKGNVKVRAKKSELETNKRVKLMVSRDKCERAVFVVVGGGPSGATCVETLRLEGFQGRIILVCKEKYLPYDRVKVSKAMDFEIEKGQFRSQDFYNEHNIEVLSNTEVISVDTANKCLSLSNSNNLSYDKCYFATGATPRIPDIPGNNLTNICTVYTYDNAKFIQSQLSKDKHIVVLGSSFIALEAAAYTVNKVEKVTVIGRGAVPLTHVFGQEIGSRIMKFFKEKGVNFIMNSGIKQCIGNDGVLSSVELLDGTVLRADLCIMGIGSKLCTDFLKGSDISMKPDGSIPVNLHMETNVSGVYAGGDIAYAAVYANDNQPATIGHFPLAHYHGRIAGMNMAGKKTESKAVPFFWTMVFGKSFRYAGHGKHDDIRIEGDLEEMKYVAYYFKGDRVIAVATCQRDPIAAQFAELLSQGRQLTKSQLEIDPFAWAN